jgi:hypothetical protein
MPQAAGTAYAIKLDEERQGDCVICYFGDGTFSLLPIIQCYLLLSSLCRSGKRGRFPCRIRYELGFGWTLYLVLSE